MRYRLIATTLVLLTSGLVVVEVRGQEEDEESPYRPGLIAAYSAGDAAAATRIDEAVAFDWADAAPDPRLPTGPFAVTWRGRLWTQSPGTHRLAVFVQGQVSLKLGGKEIITGKAAEPRWLVSNELDLPFDYHPLEITYRRTGERGRVALYWTGPNFVLEPIPQRFLFHDRTESPSQAFERGRQLAAALRCAACHPGDAAAAMPAPALDRLSGNISREWLVAWLAHNREGEAPAEPTPRRMPHLGITVDEANAIADWLLRLPAEKPEEMEQKDAKDAKKSGKEKKSQPSANAGEQLFLTLGCLACHQHGSLGESGLFGGGDLTKIAAKRPPEYFSRWLADPASLNKHHRMPVFELSPDERTSLSLWLAQQGTPASLAPRGRGAGGEGADASQGEKLVARFRCAACHTLPGVKDQPLANPPQPLTAKSDWSKSCAGTLDAQANRPRFQRSADDQAALQAYFSITPLSRRVHAAQSGRDLLVQLNCLACHQREGIDRDVNLLPARLQDKLLAVAEVHSDLAKQIPAMTPPALNSVGDKLHDEALAAAIRRQGKPHRPYLLVRMPKFNLTDEQLAALTNYFVSVDRIPTMPDEIAASIRNPQSAIRNSEAALTAAGPRLVTTDGFGCTSCHQVGSVQADKAPLNARGPNLSLLDKRIRREWFDRWCNSPARIVPRMEMPSVQVPVRGVLGDNVHDQLAAVWHTLNTPGFEPPEPNPIRVLRLSGVSEREESPIILHDVVKDGDKTYLFPLVIGLPNRHNILFDLETNRLAAWWLGDTARQRTKGKSWWWEVGGKPILNLSKDEASFFIQIGGKEYEPAKQGQFTAAIREVESNRRVGANTSIDVEVPSGPGRAASHLSISNGWLTHKPRDGKHESGFMRVVSCGSFPSGAQLRIRLVDSSHVKSCKWVESKLTLQLPEGLEIRVEPLFQGTHAKWNGDGTVTIDPTRSTDLSVGFTYVIKTSILDQYLVDPRPELVREPHDVLIGDGFNANRLPLPDSLMPSALTWTPGGRLVFTTLKGQLVVADEHPVKSNEVTWRILDDGLATPYGIYSHENTVDVLTKTGLYRILVPVGEGQAFTSVRRNVLASGWGVTDDYHDWAVGLLLGHQNEYYLTFPCQQDQRIEVAAKHRGDFIALRSDGRAPVWPHYPTFKTEVLSSGHRFPMGLAMNRAGDLFVTDNQGNYNPFNELNHVRPGKHFGFINANEKEAGFKPPPLEEPAINIPHPWTRSVNGICFLDTPAGLGRVGSAHQDLPGKEKEGKVGTAHPTIFGPLEGHLIGCEYDTRRLIRMTLQKIGDTYQGAAYPLSIPPDDVEKGLLGPIVCAVKPTTGELYIGEIRDSGWGAGNNVGQIVKIKIEPEKLPCGIAEMKATADGFSLDFFQPVDSTKAADAANYSLQSYRRESTPAYGGPDLDRRTEKFTAIEVSADKKRVTLKLPEMRERFVYELRLKNLAPKNAMFHPDEAHFTLRQVPK